MTTRYSKGSVVQYSVVRRFSAPKAQWSGGSFVWRFSGLMAQWAGCSVVRIFNDHKHRLAWMSILLLEMNTYQYHVEFGSLNDCIRFLCIVWFFSLSFEFWLYYLLSKMLKNFNLKLIRWLLQRRNVQLSIFSILITNNTISIRIIKKDQTIQRKLKFVYLNIFAFKMLLICITVPTCPMLI